MPIEIRVMTVPELPAVALLVRQAFDDFVAPLYSREGIAEFYRFASPEAIQQRDRQDSITFVARSDDRIVGMLQLRDWRHITLLFVSGSLQRSGVGRSLVRHAVEQVLAHDPLAAEVTVNSSPNGVSAYQRFGFLPTGAEQVHQGIRFLPMKLRLPPDADP